MKEVKNTHLNKSKKTTTLLSKIDFDTTLDNIKYLSPVDITNFFNTLVGFINCSANENGYQTMQSWFQEYENKENIIYFLVKLPYRADIGSFCDNDELIDMQNLFIRPANWQYFTEICNDDNFKKVTRIMLPIFRQTYQNYRQLLSYFYQLDGLIDINLVNKDTIIKLLLQLEQMKQHVAGENINTSELTLTQCANLYILLIHRWDAFAGKEKLIDSLQARTKTLITTPEHWILFTNLAQVYPLNNEQLLESAIAFFKPWFIQNNRQQDDQTALLISKSQQDLSDEKITARVTDMIKKPYQPRTAKILDINPSSFIKRCLVKISNTNIESIKDFLLSYVLILVLLLFGLSLGIFFLTTALPVVYAIFFCAAFFVLLTVPRIIRLIDNIADFITNYIRSIGFSDDDNHSEDTHGLLCSLFKSPKYKIIALTVLSSIVICTSLFFFPPIALIIFSSVFSALLITGLIAGLIYSKQHQKQIATMLQQNAMPLQDHFNLTQQPSIRKNNALSQQQSPSTSVANNTKQTSQRFEKSIQPFSSGIFPPPKAVASQQTTKEGAYTLEDLELRVETLPRTRGI